MTETKQTNSEPITERTDGRNGNRTINAETANNNYVKDCPFKFMGLHCPCSGVPDNSICATPRCWNIGANMTRLDWREISEKQITEFAKSFEHDDYDVIMNLIDSYLKNVKGTVN